MRLLITAFIMLATLIGLSAWLGPMTVERIRERLPKPEPTLVRLERPVRGDLVERIQAPGEIEPKTKVDLSARISARIVALPFREGQRVTKGDPTANHPIPPSVLVQLDATELEASLRAAQARRSADAASIEVHRARLEGQSASIEGIRASLRQAELELERHLGLLSTRDVSQATVDQLQARVDELRASVTAQELAHAADRLTLRVMEHNLEAADASIEQAEENLRHTTILSPIDGIVTRLNAEVGELVMTGTMNNPGTVILQVADLDRMLLVAQVDEAAIGAVEVGQPCIVRINAYPGREFSGVVETIALTHDKATDGSKYYKTEILLDTDGMRIYSGLTADVEIETRRHEDVLMVPSQAVLARPVDSLPAGLRLDNPDVDVTRTIATVVYRFIDGKAVVTPVSIGPSDAAHTVILSGLSKEDRIIVGPYRVLDMLSHEMEVKDERASKNDTTDEHG